MTKIKMALSVCLVLGLLLCPMTGLGEEVEQPAAEAATVSFSYSDGIDENGFWAGLKALDYVTLPEYMGVQIPADAHTVQDADVQASIDSILASYVTTEQSTDRAVADGDTVNIDYVGSVDGVEFDGGSTGGNGTEVTIGVTSYIDDFLEQLIGHMPGETFNVEVTFPEEYGVEQLNGKDAVFVTTINHVVTTVSPELSDTFVSENLSAANGWTTVDEMRNEIQADLVRDAVYSYITNYLMSGSAVPSVPDQLVTYQENSMLNYYGEYAVMYGMELEEFVAAYVGASSLDELKESNREQNTESAKNSLVLQAVAEDAGITVSTEDIATYFSENMGTDDYSTYEAQYGLPYLKQIVLHETVMARVAENAVFE